MASKPAGKAAAKPAAAPEKQPLPQKEQKLLRDLLKCTELRKYKRAIRYADTILKKYPDHGDTLAMKGYTLALLDKKDEALDLVKRGLKAELFRSHVCWQMNALIHRHFREHTEAAKCFSMAIRNCPATNKDKILSLLRDLALEQVMCGDYKGYADSRNKFLAEKPGPVAHWMNSATAAHLLGDLEGAVRYIDAYDAASSKQEKRESFDDKFAYSEMLMYKIMLLEQLGEYDRALVMLLNRDGTLLDKLAVQEMRGSIYLKRKEYAEAESIFRQLLAGNTENLAYHRRLLEALRIVEDDKLVAPSEKLLTVYAQLAKDYPKSHAVVHFPIRFLHGAEFRTRFEAAVRPLLRKGVPALFNSCKGFYSEAGRVAIIEEVITSYLTSLRQNNRFPGSEQDEDPTVLLWALVFAAQHFNEVEQWQRAFELIDEAIKHTPTIIDLYVFKSRFYKHAGDPETASQLMEKARQLDLADRYLNTRSARYLLRANHTEQAEKVVSIFTTDMETGISNLYDMQVSWWRQNLGEAHQRLGHYGLALKAFLGVQKDYDQIYEDQLDFHSYCARKQTLRAYMDLVRLEEQLHGQRAYARALGAIVDTYVVLHKAAAAKEPATEAEAAEQKKAEAKRKKAEARKAEEEDEAKKKAAAEQAKAVVKRKGRSVVADPDPTGEALVKTAEPLAEAAKFVRKIYHANAKRLEVQLSSFEVFFLQKRLLLALQAVRRANALAPQNPAVLSATVRLFHLVDNTKDVNPVVASVLKLEREALLGGSKDLVAHVKAYAAAHTCIGARAAAAEMSVLLNAGEKAAAIKSITEGVSAKGSVDAFANAHRLLQSWDPAAAAAFKEAVHSKRLPYSTYFGSTPVKIEEEAKDD